ncbi:flavodoxin [uncultured Cohaesibacter sp.]|uniref:flavodoxin n=1 Tax=uncultured Cohaesibacter sp. TaxID=1002546 RepID=UPI00292EE759|nr:flavodoxin [uncultured Cohaesibacter sp.]
MNGTKGINRRSAFFQLLGTTLGLGVATHSVAQAEQFWTGNGSSSTLVAFLSRSGNTRMIAETLARQMSADLFEIRTSEPYPDDYQAHVRLARQQQETGELPALSGGVPGLEGYQSVVLAFPVWGQDIPAPVRSFLAGRDMGNRNLFPCITHGGYGPGRSLETLGQLVPDAQIKAAFIKQCDSERETLGLLADWTATVMPS